MTSFDSNVAAGLIGYLILVAILGYWGSKHIESESDFFLGGEKLPGWALALSERSSDMSGWLLLGLPGLAWATGLSSVWVIVGAAGGAIFQWIVFSRPFMEGRKETGAVTPVGLIAEKLPGDQDTIRSLTALVTFIFFMGYVGSQFLAGGTIFQDVFGVSPTVGLVVVAVLIILYSIAGGFLAVVWTDAMQALLMVFTLIVLPGMLLVQVITDPSLAIMRSLEASGGGRASWFGGATGGAALLLLGANLSWFFGTLGGFPHLDARFMALRSESDRRVGILVSTVWGVLTSIGAILLGLLARTLHGAPAAFEGNREMVLPFMITEHTPDIVSGILLAGALAAMMSTADSQLIVASSAAAHDIYTKVINKGEDFSEKVQIRISRLGTLAVGMVGLGIAYFTESLVYTLVSYSATGLFSAFGPAFTLLFFWGDNLSKQGVLAAFIAGPVTTIIWVAFGFTDIVTVRLVAPPVGFAAAIIGSFIWPRPHETTQSEPTSAMQD
ncbi:sodium/proline symporter [Halobacterium sp. KA-6]|uniref:sodium/proline symporter n=1 Tax=Halobacterium sp. KA-6 TaxID=2896368 RepID=UPI001E62DC5E|nr:sodium/proline symporter [Halobacterium sp. KA-6]MCD2205268.1 sodium/proline symporter [Halobacterium sp. KA-6]